MAEGVELLLFVPLAAAVVGVVVVVVATAVRGGLRWLLLGGPKDVIKF